MDLKSLFSKSSNEKSQLGLYWGKDAFSLSEIAKGFPDKIIHIRFDSPVPGEQGQKIPDTLRLTALLQQAIREKKLVSKKVNISLSAKDVIYRSFVIPFMQPNEVKNVVDFEATKYIPIKLDELAYTYHSIPFSEGEQKSLRILFVAAKKITLEKYTGILQQAGLEVDFIEPAAVSLLRILQKQNHVPRQQATAIIEIENEGGRISVIDKDIIQFVREFQSPIEGIGIPAENAKFFNDIRVSFNFYQRQNAQAKLDRIVIIAQNDFTALATGLGQEFKVPASAVTIAKILKDQAGDIGSLNAFGIANRDRVASTKNFDLTIKTSKALKGAEVGNTFAEWNLKNLGLGLGFAAVIIYGTSFLTKTLLNDARRTTEKLTQQLGIYASSDKNNITELKNNIITKMHQYQDVRIKSNIASYLKRVPILLPKGIWLNNFNVEYYEVPETSESGERRVISKVSLSFDGFVYLPDPNEQIRQVNNFYVILKEDEKFSKLFTEIALSNVKQDMQGNFPVTYFQISLK